MKTSARKMAVAACAMAAFGSFIAAAPATAADPAPVQVRTFSAAHGDKPPAALIGPHGEKPKEWGVASYPLGAKLGAKGLIAPSVAKGGGTWNYGTNLDGTSKGCYSNYIHPSKKHSASVSIANATDKDVREADIWAKAYATAGAAHTCNAYWGVY
ncbi:lactococcin 972 family bacteriocin [Streptomyces sp. NPDC001817]|uniref:lactococcin 972 family bacteriocin n=1 Tax=Streptomyces sp. NPDC001817 TaxID=3154398 RepID=UPI003316C011